MPGPHPNKDILWQESRESKKAYLIKEGLYSDLLDHEYFKDGDDDDDYD